MKGMIVIELETTTPDSGSGLPDLGHDAYWLKKQIPQLEFKDTNGNLKPLSTKYQIVAVKTEGRA